jgi:hypothetical protein
MVEEDSSYHITSQHAWYLYDITDKLAKVVLSEFPTIFPAQYTFLWTLVSPLDAVHINMGIEEDRTHGWR